MRHRHGPGHARAHGEGQDVRPRGLHRAHARAADDEQTHYRGLRPRGRGQGRRRAGVPGRQQGQGARYQRLRPALPSGEPDQEGRNRPQAGIRGQGAGPSEKVKTDAAVQNRYGRRGVQLRGHLPHDRKGQGRGGVPRSRDHQDRPGPWGVRDPHGREEDARVRRRGRRHHPGRRHHRRDQARRGRRRPVLEEDHGPRARVRQARRVRHHRPRHDRAPGDGQDREGPRGRRRRRQDAQEARLLIKPGAPAPVPKLAYMFGVLPLQTSFFRILMTVDSGTPVSMEILTHPSPRR